MIGPITVCRICDSTDLNLVLDLGNQPWCNDFLTADRVGWEAAYPLRLVHCGNCGAAQIDYTVPKEVMFSTHTYLTGSSQMHVDHFWKMADLLVKRYFPDKKPSVLDIGSNDGTWLKAFRALGCEVLGIDPGEAAVAAATEAGIPTIKAFLKRGVINQKFDLITAAGVFYHLEDLHEVTEAVREMLKPNGIFAVQCLSAYDMVRKTTFDQIYHEHLLYYNVTTLDVLLQMHGLQIFDVHELSVYGGAFLAIAGHDDMLQHIYDDCFDVLRFEAIIGANEFAFYKSFAKRVETLKRYEVFRLKDLKSDHKRVYGFGAPAKGNTMLNYFGIGPDLLTYLVDNNPLHQNMYSPGMHIPIRLEREIDRQPDAYYVLSWNFKEDILRKNAGLIEQSVRFLFPRNGT